MSDVTTVVKTRFCQMVDMLFKEKFESNIMPRFLA